MDIKKIEEFIKLIKKDIKLIEDLISEIEDDPDIPFEGEDEILDPIDSHKQNLECLILSLEDYKKFLNWKNKEAKKDG